MIERLVNLGLRLDQEAAKKPGDPEQRSGLMAKTGLTQIEFIDQPREDPSIRPALPGVVDKSVFFKAGGRPIPAFRIPKRAGRG